MEDPIEGNPTPRRSLRGALTEIHDTPNENPSETPKTTSPDEQIIIQRGPRRKPLTWSPYEYNKAKILGPPRDKTPEKTPSPKPDINWKLRRRLVMSPEKNQVVLGEMIARRLRSFAKSREFFNNEEK